MLRFMLVKPNADELCFFSRVSFKQAFRFAKRDLQWSSDPEFLGETRAHLYIACGDHFRYVRTLWIQADDIPAGEIERFSSLDPVKMFAGC